MIQNTALYKYIDTQLIRTQTNIKLIFYIEIEQNNYLVMKNKQKIKNLYKIQFFILVGWSGVRTPNPSHSTWLKHWLTVF